MPVQVGCACGAKFMAQDHLIGTTVGCPMCGQALPINAPSSLPKAVPLTPLRPIAPQAAPRPTLQPLQPQRPAQTWPASPAPQAQQPVVLRPIDPLAANAFAGQTIVGEAVVPNAFGTASGQHPFGPPMGVAPVGQPATYGGYPQGAVSGQGTAGGFDPLAMRPVLPTAAPVPTKPSPVKATAPADEDAGKSNRTTLLLVGIGGGSLAMAALIVGLLVALVGRPKPTVATNVPQATPEVAPSPSPIPEAPPKPETSSSSAPLPPARDNEGASGSGTQASRQSKPEPEEENPFTEIPKASGTGSAAIPDKPEPPKTTPAAPSPPPRPSPRPNSSRAEFNFKADDIPGQVVRSGDGRAAVNLPGAPSELGKTNVLGAVCVTRQFDSTEDGSFFYADYQLPEGKPASEFIESILGEPIPGKKVTGATKKDRGLEGRPCIELLFQQNGSINKVRVVGHGAGVHVLWFSGTADQMSAPAAQDFFRSFRIEP